MKRKLEGEKRNTKRPVILFIIGLFVVLAVTIGVSVFVSVAADARRRDNLNEQLLLGVNYLTEMNYEAAVACFDRVLEIDPRNVAAYMGNALAYEYLEDKEKVLQTLTTGIENTENDVLNAMMSEMRRGRSLTDHYNLVASDEKLNILDSPFQTLEILGSDFYQWDFSACASLFGFRYEEYAGQKVDLGNYQGLDVQFDATKKNIEFIMKNEDYAYEYKLLSDSQLQIFGIGCTGVVANEPALSEVDWSLEMGCAYDDMLESMGLEDPEDGTFYIAESNIGVVQYIQWRENGSNNLYLYLSEKDPLGLRLRFERRKLMSAVYTCEVPDNLRSKVIGWVGDIIN